MKKSINNTLLALSLLLISSAVMAALPVAQTDLVVRNYNTAVIKVKASAVTKDMNGIGFETSFGARYKLSDVRFINPNAKSALSNVLKKDRIELRSGEIIYQEEITYGLIKSQKISNIQIFNPFEKAPHTPD